MPVTMSKPSKEVGDAVESAHPIGKAEEEMLKEQRADLIRDNTVDTDKGVEDRIEAAGQKAGEVIFKDVTQVDLVSDACVATKETNKMENEVV